MLAYPIRLTKDDNGTFMVTCAAFPEVTTYGETVQDACAHAVDAIEEAIAARMVDRALIPLPGRTGKTLAVLPAQTVAKILLYQAMLERRVTKIQLARSLRWHRPQVDRLLNLKHSTNMNQIETAFEALGKKVRIEIDEAG